MCLYLRTKFQVPCLVLISFRQGAEEEGISDTLAVKRNLSKGLTRLVLIKYF